MSLSRCIEMGQGERQTVAKCLYQEIYSFIYIHLQGKVYQNYKIMKLQHLFGYN